MPYIQLLTALQMLTIHLSVMKNECENTTSELPVGFVVFRMVYQDRIESITFKACINKNASIVHPVGETIVQKIELARSCLTIEALILCSVCASFVH